MPAGNSPKVSVKPESAASAAGGMPFHGFFPSRSVVMRIDPASSVWSGPWFSPRPSTSSVSVIVALATARFAVNVVIQCSV